MLQFSWRIGRCPSGENGQIMKGYDIPPDKHAGLPRLDHSSPLILDSQFQIRDWVILNSETYNPTCPGLRLSLLFPIFDVDFLTLVLRKVEGIPDVIF
jgi:hypothetical protein